MTAETQDQMFTTEVLTASRHAVYYETDAVLIAVGEISLGHKGKWEFHHMPTARFLKEPARGQLTVYGRQKAAMQAVTARLTE